MENRALQIGAAAVLMALLLRFAGNWEKGIWEVGNALLLFSTGRMVSETFPAEEPTEEAETVTAETQSTAESAVPVFGEEAVSLVQVSGDWEVDTGTLLRNPLSWQLKAQTPTVLILHTHATESYIPTGNYQETSPYRTLDMNYNMVAVGDRVTELLEAGGIRDP